MFFLKIGKVKLNYNALYFNTIKNNLICLVSSD